MRGFFVVIPATGFLHNASSHLKKLDLALTLAFDGMRDCLKGVQVLHLGTGSKLWRTDLADRDVDIGTHGAFV